MTGTRGVGRTTWWLLAGAGAAVAAGLLVWVTAADLERSSQIAGVVGSVVGVVALGVAFRQLRSGTPTVPAPEPVRAADGSNAARGSIRSASAHDTATGGPAPAAGTEAPGITATGGSNAAGGDIDGSTARHGS
ncbi:hypothetical protein ACWCPT_03585 [Streptomyces sp. NPDC002308]